MKLFRKTGAGVQRGTLGIMAILALAGATLLGSFNLSMEYTNSLEFCISCHEMEQTVYKEYQQSVHYKNRTGVRVVCADCHVPKAWFPKIIRKIKASGELYHKLVGSIDTPEKFEAKRLELAEHVWRTMEDNDSAACRNCHQFDAMDFEKQQNRSAEKHPEAQQAGDSCIDCHKGVAHNLPADYDEDD